MLSARNSHHWENHKQTEMKSQKKTVQSESETKYTWQSRLQAKIRHKG